MTVLQDKQKLQINQKSLIWDWELRFFLSSYINMCHKVLRRNVKYVSWKVYSEHLLYAKEKH